MRPTALLYCLPFLALHAQSVDAQTIIGKILNEATGEGVVAADVQLVDPSGQVRGRSVADTAGLFRLVAPVPGRYALRVSSIGYATTVTKPVQLTSGLELNIEVRLSTQAVPIEPLRVVTQRTYRVGRLGEYYQRADWTRKSGFGKVLMRDDLDRMSGLNTSSILRSYPARISCSPLILLDGLRLDSADLSLLDTSVRPEDIEGIEFYRSANEIPIEYASRAGCGLVMIWTRQDVPNGKPFSWKRVAVALGLVTGLIVLTR